ncbi:hypothetical protein Dsin_021928 [Dipteronia sinensis]|uniref:Uncharacterized protein n=1 Tax=Dipteronia sinensis TaxID=43782 RepID=A0AAE0A0U2_9ROSI|nr:hypothetical protein Dsin_021928 [Dipteronia sinensis]
MKMGSADQRAERGSTDQRAARGSADQREATGSADQRAATGSAAVGDEKKEEKKKRKKERERERKRVRLRNEIIHTNGNVSTTLEIHGRLGMICHAILEIRQSTYASQYQMFDFYKKSIEDVKNFLVQYCEEQKQAGFFFLVPPNPCSIFYDALCVGLDSDENRTSLRNDYTQPPVATNSGANGMR